MLPVKYPSDDEDEGAFSIDAPHGVAHSLAAWGGKVNPLDVDDSPVADVTDRAPVSTASLRSPSHRQYGSGRSSYSPSASAKKIHELSVSKSFHDDDTSDREPQPREPLYAMDGVYSHSASQVPSFRPSRTRFDDGVERTLADVFREEGTPSPEATEEATSNVRSPNRRTAEELSRPSHTAAAPPPPPAAPYIASSRGAQSLEERRHQLTAEKFLIEKDRVRLEELLARYTRAPPSPVRSTEPSSPHKTAEPRMGSPKELTGRAAAGDVTSATALSPIQPIPYADRSETGSPVALPRGSSAGHPSTASPAHSPSPVRVPHPTVVDSHSVYLHQEIEDRGTSTAIVREVREEVSPPPRRESLDSESVTQPARSRSKNAEGDGRPIDTAEAKRRARQDAAVKLTEKLKEIAQWRRSDEKRHTFLSETTEALACTPSPRSLDVFRRRGRLLTPRVDDTRGGTDEKTSSGALENRSLAVANTLGGPPLLERRPRLRWDVERSANVLLSADGCACLADGSRARQVALAEYHEEMKNLDGSCLEPCMAIPLYALGTLGVSAGDFVFEVRLDTQRRDVPVRRPRQPVAHAPTGPTDDEQEFRFAVGVTSEHFRGPDHSTLAYLYGSNGTLLCGSGSALFSCLHVAPGTPPHGAMEKPYGVPFGPGDRITCVLQLSLGSLSFFCNGSPMGPAFRFLTAAHPEPLFPVVLLRRDGDTAALVRPFFA